ncbi:zinc-dependent alcohol dehydrogenase [Numidum massiliense]|uniref:zinc-dependent alcohol dehydrogenase n=1 Tax=Numidum massiliense TaxID=1522315 RepID=UPI0006D59D51|nr:zinc-binding alcohol dehydrogenase [Numidum massiliense]
MKCIARQRGEVLVTDFPRPETAPKDHVLVKTTYSAISPGTEMMMIEQNNPNPSPLGYCAAGEVIEVGDGVTHVQKGDRVTCYGAPYVYHAEYLVVPKNLAVSVPETVDLKAAAFSGIGAIVIHGLRQANMQFGETAVVLGLGLLGQLTAQIAENAGYRVIAYDLLASRRKMMRETSRHVIVCDTEEQLEAHLGTETEQAGADSVLICASAENAELIDTSLAWLRDRGRIVIVGDLPVTLDRELMFQKEAELAISRAGGPGRYDRHYEKGGVDYPIGYVRWTEGRNMQEYVHLLAENKLQVDPLISRVLHVDDARKAYDSFRESPETTLGIIIEY